MQIRACAGRDPKPFPPPMKLCKEMVDAMGGADSGALPPVPQHGVRGVQHPAQERGAHPVAGPPDGGRQPSRTSGSDPEKALLKLQVLPPVLYSSQHQTQTESQSEL